MRYVELLEETSNDICVFDSSWASFIETCNSLPLNVSFEEACSAVGLNPPTVKQIISKNIQNWRDSTTTSIFHALAHVKLGVVPSGNIFDDLLWQTRFLKMCLTDRFISIMDVENIEKNKKPLMVRNAPALKVKISGQAKVNRIIKGLYLYWFLNSRKKVKIPKILYRGIRAHDLFNHENFKDVMTKLDLSGSIVTNRKTAIDALIRFICDKKLHKITDGHLLSFTATIPTAKYFSNGNGFILKVDTSRVEIITSEVHDEELSGPEPAYGRIEREYIIKIPKDYDFKPSDIMINDKDYLLADKNPLCVALFDHDDIRAKYEMHGIEITARFIWNSNGTAGSLRFVTPDHWEQYTRGNFKKSFGFDPLPTESNLKDINNFRLEKSIDAWNQKWRPY